MTNEITRLKCIIIDNEQAPPVPLDGEDADTLESVNTRMDAADYASLVDFDEALPWRVNEELGGL